MEFCALRASEPSFGRYYVYRLIDPVTGRQFYVGKGQGKRAWHHEANVRAGKLDHNPRKVELIANILSLGLSVEVEIIQRFNDADDALDLEWRLIREDPSLTNDVSGRNDGAQLEARLRRLRGAKRIRLERRAKVEKEIRQRLEKILLLTKDPKQRAEARVWVRKEVEGRLMWRNSKQSKIIREQRA